MKLKQLFAVALFAGTPAFASASGFLVDFEKTWDYTNGDVNDYYNGGSAADGSMGGANLGVSFVNVSGLSNDADFTYYTGAPSAQGTAYAHDTAYINVAAGVNSGLSFFYSSPVAVIGAVKAYSGLNGTGTLLGSFDLAANNSGAYDTWTQATFLFNGAAQSFDLTAAGTNFVGLDNVSSVPVPAAFWLLGSGLAMLGAVGRRGKASI
ncbi:VPLPA-CTERM sorting domain-containing protein [Methylomonas albis]|uniref:VPLPA-CTERM sorting domain-containing protein n=1 Tax=Methylomonas albis TaxID=1854563 RepID=A0ABR9D6F1_9GAMM|nr:VPLPA-CTERM sorting domain-containing protein [Methylomonas albis]MBD9357472.1 VPLPA-CTERM sorting domain-containing protein [Methylomonas albis]